MFEIDRIREEPFDFVRRLQAAVEGVLDGLSITPAQAHEILLWAVLRQVPDDADRMRLRHDICLKEAARQNKAEREAVG